MTASAIFAQARSKSSQASGNSPNIQRGRSILPAMSSIDYRKFAAARLRVMAALAAVVLSSCASTGNAAVAPKSSADVRARVVELVNAARGKGRKCGSERFSAAPQLIASPQLNEAATRHARDMARRNYFDHRGADGSQPKDRVLRAGYQSRLTGENIALGPESAEEVVAGWLASPGHCANIMDSRFQHIGVGLATGSGRGKIYWVQNFGAPHSEPKR